jgi:hypothetical protein
MRILISIVLIVIFHFKSLSQIKHNFTNVILVNSGNTNSIQKNRWYKSIGNEDITFIQFFNKNPIGIKKALELAEEICLDNDLDFDNPNKDKSYFASFVKSINDFENLDLSIRTGGSIVEKIWHNQNSKAKIALLRIELSEDSYLVSILNPK